MSGASATRRIHTGGGRGFGIIEPQRLVNGCRNFDFNLFKLPFGVHPLAFDGDCFLLILAFSGQFWRPLTQT